MAATWGHIGLGLLQGLALIGGAPLMMGFLRWFEARWQGYQGSSPLQPYRDIAKLLRMSSVRPEQASVVFGAAPYLLFALYGAVACAIPIFARRALLDVDLILLIYLLTLARFVLSLAGLDVGASFGGLGSSREMFFHFLTEVGLAIFVAGLAIRWRTTDLSAILQAHWGLGLVQFAYHPDLILLAFAFGFLVLFEMERIPLNNPVTHLELTMAHRAIVLEYAGRDLAVLEWAEMVKVAALLILFGALFLSFPTALSPFRTDPNAVFTAAVSAFFRTVVLVAGLAGWKLTQPTLRLRAVTGPALTAIVLSLTAILYGITLGR